MKILYVGDIVGRPGRNAVKVLVPQLRHAYNVDLVFANGENLAAGLGMTYDKYREMVGAGIDYFTSGNHIWSKQEFVPYLDDPEVCVLRPANYATNEPGRGFGIIEKDGVRVQLVNLLGRAFMKGEISDYFDVMDNILTNTEADIRIVDFHAEATSEKIILATYLDGKVSALVGTHTHVPTADERILPHGTAFQTDLGMVGPLHSSLGATIQPRIDAMRTGSRALYKVAKSPVTVFNATLLEIDSATGTAKRIERIQRYLDVATGKVSESL